MEKNEYIKYVEATEPKSHELRTIITAFVVGGIICMIGQLVNDLLTIYVTMLDEKQISSLTTIIMIFLGAFFTGLGLYDKLGYYAGAGSILPITGFANSIVSPAMEYNKEGIIYGTMAKMFVISGPIIVSGICASTLVGIIFYVMRIAGVAV